MKLIACHIENFGKLSNADYAFENEITQFCEENGFGKSTLAAFIKAMFYGLPSVRANTKEFNDRKRFYPFSGAKFGGYLTFEMGGKAYKIVRYFDKKSETADELVVYCNNSPCSALGVDIGKAVFGVDKESFERTVFITSEIEDMCATGSISAKLNNFVDNSDSENTFDDACDRLEKAKKRLKAARGEGGLINERKKEIQSLRSEIHDLESVSQSLQQQYKEANGLRRAIEDKEKQVRESQNINRMLEHWEQYENMALRLSEEEQALHEIERKYPAGLPTSAEIDALKECVGKTVSLSGKREAVEFSDENKSRLTYLSKVFAEGVPDDNAMRDLQSDINKIAALRVRADTASAPLSERDSALAYKFERGLPTNAEMASVTAEIEQYRKLDAQWKEQSDIVTTGVPVKPRKNGAYLTAAIGAMIFIIAGIICLIAVNAVLGGTALGIGAVALFVDGFLFLHAGKSNAYTVAVDAHAVKDRAEMKQIEERVRAFLVPYGCYSPNGIVFDFAAFEKDLNEYLDKQETDDKNEKERQAMCNEIEELVQKAKDIFLRYDVAEDDLQAACMRLQNNISEYARLCKDAESVNTAQTNTADEISRQRQKISALLQPYAIEPQIDLSAQVDALHRDAENTTRLKKELADKKNELQRYKHKYALTRKPIAEKCDIDALEGEIASERAQLAVVTGRIAEDESAVEQLDDKRGSLTEKEENLQTLQAKYATLDATLRLLRQAERNLKDRYIAPIKANFLQYAQTIEKTLGEKAEMDENFNITFERGGEWRSDRHLSAGQRSVCSLCFRIALVNNMYTEEKPFLIMDDPFVNLDATHMEKTLQAVKALSKDNQILYFSCHASRKIG